MHHKPRYTLKTIAVCCKVAHCRLFVILPLVLFVYILYCTFCIVVCNKDYLFMELWANEQTYGLIVSDCYRPLTPAVKEVSQMRCRPWLVRNFGILIHSVKHCASAVSHRFSYLPIFIIKLT